jgi:hypothetical protein
LEDARVLLHEGVGPGSENIHEKSVISIKIIDTIQMIKEMM